MPRKRSTVRLLVIMAALLLSAAVQSQAGVSNTGYHYDSEASLNLDEFIANIESAGRFVPFDNADIPVGRGNHWVFGDIELKEAVDADRWFLEINFPNIDRVEAFILHDDGSVDRFLVGDEVAFNDWPLSYRKPSIPLNMSTSGSAKFYLKVASETPLILPIEVISQRDRDSTEKNEYFLYGIFYGAIFILALYNAGVYVSLRDKSYLYYVLYILAFSLVQATTTGIGQQYLWPGLENATTRISLFAIASTNFFMIFFVIYFLDLKSYAPNLITPLRCIAWIALLCVPTLLLSQYAYTQYFLHGLNLFSMVAIGFVITRVFRHNTRPTMYLLVGYSILFSTIVLALLFQASLISYYSYTDFSMSVAIIFEAIVLSIGLSERIAKLRIENEQSERAQRIVQEELAQQLIQAREHERSEISKLLHDSVSHDLVVIQRKISQLGSADIPQQSSLADRIDDINGKLSTTIDDIRNISHLSHPRIAKHLGLEPALSALLKSTFGSSITWNLYIQDIYLGEDTQLLLYRAVQEATTNIIKHAEATECIVRLEANKTSGEVRFVIKDDGQGFMASSRSWRFGLRTLNEHCKALAALLDVQSSPEKGTTLTIIFPYRSEGEFNG
ncbi:Oxygen sensor histidine kinase NreB [Halioglobus japonicus]|nr:Oxygen sensor histidine kinase NreB [Halioglobus japonicus]